MGRLLLVCLGGAIGSGARYLVSTLAARAVAGYPLGTLVVNVTGSFLLAAIMGVSLGSGAIGPDLRAFLGAGVMGGFTTYSSFNYETLHFLDEGAIALALANLAITVAACLVSGALGLLAARVLARASGFAV